MAGWIDFRALCKSVEFSKVLELYSVKLNVKRDQAHGFCPLPNHKGQRRSPSFSVNLAKGIWQCFGCSAKGNVIDFVARMEGLDPFKGKNVRKAAEILQEKLHVSADAGSKTTKRDDSRDDKPTRSTARKADLPVVVNAPLDFELKNLDPEHPYLLKRGFSAQTIRKFGLGYCNRGLFRDRAVIPIHDDSGKLVAYAGRVISDLAINEQNPKYKLPAPREHEGKIYEFHKSELLYNAHRIEKRVSDLIVVEGFPSVWWLHQNDFENAVALMGSDCSDAQATLILQKVETDGRIWILTDGDEAGRRCAERLLFALSAFRFVRWARLRDGEQPTDCTIDDLQAMLSI